MSGNDPTIQHEEADDPRLLAAVQEYMTAVEAGQRPNRQELLARHPDIAEELSACLQGLAFVNSAAAQMGSAAGASRKHAAARAGEEVPHAQPLGDFQLIREIGRGGMGVVYEAIQLSLGRPVAVKVLPLAAALDERHLQRFKNEAQAAAQLHHTNIVPVYAVGCERSVHFYAMQLIDGQSVAEIIRELRHHTPTATREDVTIAKSTVTDRPSTELLGPSRPPDRARRIDTLLSTRADGKRSDFFRTVARLGLQAAEALEYDHQQGVVHRDIKPANLMVDRKGNLWITDFGLAQFYGDTGLTTTDDLLGTVRYMSPEQASGRTTLLDQRTDVYSLGITLYELITLEPAIRGQTREELLRQIETSDPRPPRSIDRSVPIELQTILARATAKEADDRYASAREFADDLERYLKDEPIHARPPSVWDKAVKWTRRHKSLTLSSIVMLVLAAAGLIVSNVIIAREQAKTKTAYVLEQQKAREANQQRALAQASYEQARQAVDLLTRVASDELSNDPPSIEARRHLLEAALGYYQSFLDQRSAGGQVDADLFAAQARAAGVLAELSNVDRVFRFMFISRLLSQAAVQRELKLSPQQQTQVDAWASSLDGGEFAPPWFNHGPMPGSSIAHDPEQLAAKVGQSEAALNAMLTPEQLNRLHQIYVQLRGIAVFSDPEVVAALSLSDDQQQAIRKLRASFGPPAHMVRGGGGGPPDRPGIEDHLQRALAVLTPAQRQTWNQLTGPKVTGVDFGFDHPGPPHDHGPNSFDHDHGDGPPPMD